MTAKRMAIRARIRDLLLNETEAADRVYMNRRDPYLARTKLPAVAIYSLTETAAVYARSPLVLRRDLRVAVEVVTEEGDETEATPPDDRADAISQVIETLLGADPYLGFDEDEVVSGFGCILEAVDLDQDASGERIVAASRLTYVVQYDSEMVPGDPDLLEPFLTAGVQYDLPGTGDPVDAEDEVDIPQD